MIATSAPGTALPVASFTITPIEVLLPGASLAAWGVTVTDSVR